MDHQKNNNNILDGDISFVWEEALSNPDKSNLNTNSNCPTPTSDQAKKAAVAAVVGEGSGTAAAAEKKRVRNGKQPAASGGGGGAGKDGEDDPAAGGGGGGDHELHIWTERERRKKMRCMFTELQELLPHAPTKPDKSTIVDEAVNYIKVLQQKHTSLQRQKLEMFQGRSSSTYDPVGSMDSSSREAFIADQGSPGHQDYQILSSGNPLSGAARYATTFKTWTAPNMVLSVCEDKAQISICFPKRAGLFRAICFFLEKYKLQVLYATVACDQFRSMFMIQAHASGGVDQVSETALSVEDLFQLAMGEIMMHISTMM